MEIEQLDDLATDVSKHMSERQIRESSLNVLIRTIAAIEQKYFERFPKWDSFSEETLNYVRSYMVGKGWVERTDEGGENRYKKVSNPVYGEVPLLEAA